MDMKSATPEAVDNARRRELRKLSADLDPLVLGASPLPFGIRDVSTLPWFSRPVNALFTKLLFLAALMVVAAVGAPAQESPRRYASGQFPAGQVYQESDLSGLVGTTLPDPSYLVGRFLYLGVINGRQLFSTYRPGLTDPNGIAFGNALLAVAFHDNAPPCLEVGKVIVSTPNEPLNLLTVERLEEGKVFAEAESRSLPVSQQQPTKE